MSVVIYGIQKPKYCVNCQLAKCCLFNNGAPMETEAPEDCPIKSIPEKHGRLVDADELWKKMSKYTDNMGAKMPFGDDFSMIHRDSACFMIENADTIIEAEGAKE